MQAFFFADSLHHFSLGMQLRRDTAGLQSGTRYNPTMNEPVVFLAWILLRRCSCYWKQVCVSSAFCSCMLPVVANASRCPGETKATREYRSVW
jgi:hypothetical protein